MGNSLTFLTENCVHMLPKEAFSDDDIADYSHARQESYWMQRRAVAYYGTCPVFTGEDEKAGYAPDDFDGRQREGFSKRQIEDAAFRLLKDFLLYEQVPVTVAGKLQNGISDELMEVAVAYINGGIDELFDLHVDSGSLIVHSLIVDFIQRLRAALSWTGSKGKVYPGELEISLKLESTILKTKGKTAKVFKKILYPNK